MRWCRVSVMRRGGVIDAVRALFLVQGVVFHSLLPYAFGSQWLVVSPEQSAAIEGLTDWLHTYRMQGYFLISGLMSWRLLEARGNGAFLQTRLRRLAVPMITVLLLVNPIEMFISNGGLVAGVRAATTRSFPAWSHLWFLAYLCVFTLLLPSVRALIANAGVMRTLERFSRRQIEWFLPVMLMALAIVTILVGRIAPAWWWSPKFGVLEPGGMALYGAYFGTGVLLARAGHITLLWSRPALPWWIMAVAGWLLMEWLRLATFRGAYTLHLLVGHGYALAMLRVIFFLVARLVHEGTEALINTLVDSSFTVYLLHQVVVVFMATLFVNVAWPPVVEIAIILTVALVVPYLVHRHVVMRSPLVAFLLNGARWPYGAGWLPFARTAGASRELREDGSG